MKRLKKVISLAIFCCFLCSCSDVAVSGRKRLNLVPDSQINQMAAQSYQKFISDNKSDINSDPAQTKLVRNVGHNIQQAVEEYMAENDRLDEIDDYQWEFNLVESEQANAWAMPGGKVVVYTGILEYTQNEAGLAVVMAHEIAHAVAKHGAEQMSHDLLLSAGGTVMREYGASEAFLKGFSIGSTYGLKLPYSRTHEYEADHLGLIFMAMAGYDPREAPRFWQRMSRGKGSGGMPEFMSTHPLDENRIQRLNSLMDEAYRYME
jgi:predicted Zn-dependent protease